MDYTRRCLMLLLALVVLCASHTARAGKVVTYYLDDLGGSLLVVTSPQKVTRIRFSAPVLDAYAASSLVSMRLEYEKDEVRLRPKEVPKEPIIGNIQVDVWDSPKIALDVRVSRNPTDAFDIVNIIRRDARDVHISELEQKTEEQELKHQQEKEADEIKHQQEIDRLKHGTEQSEEHAADRAFAEQLRKDKYLVPSKRAPIPNGHGMAITIGPADWRGNKFGVSFVLTNGGIEPFKVGRVRVRDGNHTPIKGKLFFNANADKAFVMPNGQLEGTVILPGWTKPRIEGMTIEITEATGLPSIFAAIRDWKVQPILIPMTEEEARDERERRENVGKVTVSLVGTYGAMWIPNPEPPGIAGELDATDIKGLGMRAGYGLHRLFTIEAETAYASTGLATFESGQVRSAMLGRLLLGVALRIPAERWIPTLRGGVGVQVASYDGVGDAVEVNPLWHFGLGLDRKVGPCSVGVGGALVTQIQAQGRSMEGSIQVGCGWKP